jgi:Trk K+ transport system NAD-binding subunit
MNTTRRKTYDNPNKATQNVLVIGGNHFGLAVAKYLTEGDLSVTFVSEEQPTDAADEVKTIHRKLSNAKDVRSLASEVTDVDLVVVVVVGSDAEALLLGYLARREFDPRDVVAGISDPANDSAFEGTGVDRIDMPRLLAEQIRDRYK